MWSSYAEYKVVIIREQTVVIIRGILRGHHTEIYSGCHTGIFWWLTYSQTTEYWVCSGLNCIFFVAVIDCP